MMIRLIAYCMTVGLRAVPFRENGVSFPATGRRVGVRGKGNEVLRQKEGRSMQ